MTSRIRKWISDHDVGCFFAAIAAAALALGEYFAFTIDPGPQTAADVWLMALVGGPCMAFLLALPLALVCVIIAMIKYPR